MIEFTKSFRTSDGSVFATLEEAQQREIARILASDPDDAQRVDESMKLAGTILDNAEKIVDILTTTKSSKPSARKVNGGTKKRKPATPANVVAIDGTMPTAS